MAKKVKEELGDLPATATELAEQMKPLAEEYGLSEAILKDFNDIINENTF
jgi:hypothetical protein